MTTKFDWAVDRLESGEEVWTLFDAKLLDMIRLYLEKEYRDWPLEIHVTRDMMCLTPVEKFVKREI